MASDQTQYLTLLEAVDRKARITTTGTEVVTTFYVEPATAAPIVICGLLGRVTGNTAKDTRVLPAHDHELPYCYCVEAHPSPFDRRAVTSGPPLLPLDFNVINPNDMAAIQAGLQKPIIFDGPNSLDKSTGKYKPTSAANAKQLCGAYIEAVYRPLPTVYTYATTATDIDNAKAFDYLDPQFTQCSRTFPVGDSLYALVQAGQTNILKNQAFGIAIGNAGTKTDTWQEFSIRRSMCPSVPWKTIQQLINRVNGRQVWKPANFTLPFLEGNTFPIGTLRFEGISDITKRTMPNCLDGDGRVLVVDNVPTTRPQTWWDFSYKFSWRTIYDWMIDSAMNISLGNVGWNYEWLDKAIAGQVGGLFSGGWFEVQYWQRKIDSHDNPAAIPMHKFPDAEDPDLPVNQSPLPNTNHPFDALFLTNAP